MTFQCFSFRRLASGADGLPAAPPAVSAVLSGVLAPLPVPAPGPVRPAAGGATYVVSPELMACMVREPLRVQVLPPPIDVVGAYLVHWVLDGVESRFHVTEAVTPVSMLREHLPLCAVEHQELRLRMGRYCCPVYSSVYTDEYVERP